MRTALLAFTCAAVMASAAETPRPSPPLTIQRTGAPAIQLSQYKGKIVVLAFILTTCPHCQELTRQISPIASEYEARGVQFVECAFNQNANMLVPQFVQQLQPSFPVGYTDNDTAMKYFGRTPNDPNTFYVPHVVFLDRTGKIVADYAGESEFMKTPAANIRTQLDKMLKAPAAATKSSKAGKTK
jgi:thiol-disulfide isomerase/thioredoxin